jgi:hypothetical protein
MKNILVAMVLLVLGCKPVPAPNINDTRDAKTAGTDALPNSAPQQPTHWIADFKALQQAAKQHDTAALKSFFRFPIYNAAHEIWYLVYGDDEVAIAQLPDSLKPFTSKDFGKYYSRLFSSPFVEAIQNIAPDSLLANNWCETKTLTASKASRFKMYANDDSSKQLILNLSFTNTYGEGDALEIGESSTIYIFDISNNRLIFKEVRLAG